MFADWGRKQVKKDKAQAYRTETKQKHKIQTMLKTIDQLRKKIERRRRREDRVSQKSADTPTRKVDELKRTFSVTLEIRRCLLFGEVLDFKSKF